MISPSRTIAVDVDGPIFKFNPRTYRGVESFGPRVKGVTRALHWLRKKGYRIVIHSSRINAVEQREHGLAWLIENLRSALLAAHIPFDDISYGKPIAAFYIDDNAIRFHDWGKALRFISGAEKKRPKKRRPR